MKLVNTISIVSYLRMHAFLLKFSLEVSHFSIVNLIIIIREKTFILFSLFCILKKMLLPLLLQKYIKLEYNCGYLTISLK